MMNPDLTLISILTLSLCIIATIRAVHFRRAASLKKKELETALHSIDSKNNELEKLKEIADRLANFKKNLSEAELSTKMQRSRITYSRASEKPITIPERYRYVHSLAEKGLSSEDIASVLTISSFEAEQLVALSNLSQK